ncbi:hypothetical protein FACS1894192_08160 [Bacilli bacterium]|nr:hypothetical protein FACS1894192_08160 [Bacilli bacterium]
MILDIYRWICTDIMSVIIIYEVYTIYQRKWKDFKDGGIVGTLTDEPNTRFNVTGAWFLLPLPYNLILVIMKKVAKYKSRKLRRKLTAANSEDSQKNN